MLKYIQRATKIIPELKDLSCEEHLWFNNSRDKEVKRRSD